MTRLLLVALILSQGDPIKPRYGVDKGPREKVSFEFKLGLKIQGTETAAQFVRSLHPLLSLDLLYMKGDGTHQIAAGKTHKIEYDQARLEARYDDQDYQIDYKKGDFPKDFDKERDKVQGLLWMLAAGGRSYSLEADGEYRSDDPNQDANGEAMDLYFLGITRMPAKSVKPGDTYEVEWKGQRSEKTKKAQFAYRQKVKVEKVGEKDGRKVAVLSSDLLGEMETPAGEKDPNAEEAWTKCEGKTRIVLDLASGRVISSEGSGKVIIYFRNTAQDGGRNEVTITLTVEGKVNPR